MSPSAVPTLRRSPSAPGTTWRTALQNIISPPRDAPSEGSSSDDDPSDGASRGGEMMFWSAVRQVVPGAEGERRRVGTAEGDIAERFTHAGLEDVVGGALSARADYTGFDDFWDPFM